MTRARWRSVRSLRPWSCVPLAVTWLALTACGPAESAPAAATASDALTLANGDRYVISADPDEGKVVLRTAVDGVPLPYDAARMVGKAVLIHPLARRAERGLYARVTAAHANGEELELTTEPLTLEEMGALREDDIIRIYLARSLTELDGNIATLGLHVLDAADAVPPSRVSAGDWTGALAGKFPSVWVVSPTPGAIQWLGTTRLRSPPAFDFQPQGKFAYRRESGLELGMRGSLSLKVALEAKGVAGGRVTIFATPEVRLPALTLIVPIGPVPVPVQLTLGGSMRCDMVAGGKVDALVNVSGDLHFGASARFHPESGVSPSRWVTSGDWPYELEAKLDAHVEGTLAPGVGFSCIMPRINLDMAIAGITGPYIAVVPQITVLKESTQLEPSLRAGWASGTLLFGSPARAELELVSKKFTIAR